MAKLISFHKQSTNRDIKGYQKTSMHCNRLIVLRRFHGFHSPDVQLDLPHSPSYCNNNSNNTRFIFGQALFKCLSSNVCFCILNMKVNES